MYLLSKIFIGIVALEHLYFLWLEMFAWETAGKKAFKGAIPDELFKPTKTLAANQGLYNGFLAAGLIWTYFITDSGWSQNIAIFFLSCVLVAAIYGAYSASKKILFIQGVPAAIALLLVLFNTYFPA
jgi:putative membrane protein